MPLVDAADLGEAEAVDGKPGGARRHGAQHRRQRQLGDERRQQAAAEARRDEVVAGIDREHDGVRLQRQGHVLDAIVVLPRSGRRDAEVDRLHVGAGRPRRSAARRRPTAAPRTKKPSRKLSPTRTERKLNIRRPRERARPVAQRPVVEHRDEVGPVDEGFGQVSPQQLGRDRPQVTRGRGRDRRDRFGARQRDAHQQQGKDRPEQEASLRACRRWRPHGSLILRSHAPHGVSKDGRQRWCIPPSRRRCAPPQGEVGLLAVHGSGY